MLPIKHDQSTEMLPLADTFALALGLKFFLYAVMDDDER